MEIGADGVEMDVQQTIDAGLVIHHDYMIDLHTDISGKIYDMTMGDLKELDLAAGRTHSSGREDRHRSSHGTVQADAGMHRASGTEIHSTDNDPDFVPRVLDKGGADRA